MIAGVLGSTGFVGKNLMLALEKAEIECVSGSRRFMLLRSEFGVDARSFKSLTNWIKRNKVTHLVNLAAECGGIGLNQRKPADLWKVTTAISHTVLEAAHQTQLQKVIMVGSVCSYPKDCPVPFKEEYLMHYGFPELTNSAYGIAKLNSLIGAQAFARQYGLNVCNLIPVNMYGPHDHFDLENSHVIPAMIRKIYDAKCSNAKHISLWGTGNATREFLFVEDFARAIILALQKLNQPDLINIGIGTEISIEDLAIKIAGFIGYGGDIVWDHSKPDGQPRRCLDVSRAERLFGFRAQIEIDDGLKRTIEWYRNHAEQKE